MAWQLPVGLSFSPRQRGFHISVYLYILCCIPLAFILIGIPLMIIIGFGSLVLAIIAAVKASQAECYRYPLTLRLVN